MDGEARYQDGEAVITPAVLRTVAEILAADGRLPEDIGSYTWGCVPASVVEVDVPVERASAIVAASGQYYTAEAPLTARIALTHRIPLTGVSHVKQLRFGYDTDARIVAWSCE
jgi:hypothetical protein